MRQSQLSQQGNCSHWSFWTRCAESLLSTDLSNGPYGTQEHKVRELLMEMLTCNSANQIIRAVEQGRQLQARGSALASLSLLINRCEDRIVTLAGSTAPTSPASHRGAEAEALQNQSPYAMLKMQQNQPWFRAPPADESPSAVQFHMEEISESIHTQAEDTYVVTEVSREVHNQVRPVQEVKIAHLVCWLQPVTRDSQDLSWKGVRTAATDLLIGSCTLCTARCVAQY